MALNCCRYGVVGCGRRRMGLVAAVVPHRRSGRNLPNRPIDVAVDGVVVGAPAPVEPHAMRVAVLVLAFAAPALASRLCDVATALHRRLLCVVLLAALPVAVALAWPGNAGPVRMPDTPQHQDDPYRTPSWR